jgi:hypothetical protein
MKLAKQVIGACAAAALVAMALDAEAGGGRGSGGRSGARSGGHHSHSHSSHRSHHGHHGSSSFVVASSFVAWPRAYYWPAYYPAAVPVVEYWYYCQPSAAYYPYVQECPTEWQPVLPTAPSPDEYIER